MRWPWSKSAAPLCIEIPFTPDPPSPALLALAKAYRDGTLDTCIHCGGVHVRTACPRVRRLQGNLPNELVMVEYWRDGRWNDDCVTWPEELAAIEVPE